MLNVKTPEEVVDLIETSFLPLAKTEEISIEKALGRTLAENICSNEFVPGFNRTSVDGYAIFAKDSFGCTESIPAILKLSAAIEMGEDYTKPLERYHCVYVPTGAKVPDGADAVVMIEYTEKFSKDEIAIIKPVSPGENMVYKGDDCKPGDVIAAKGTKVSAQNIACFASLGISKLKVNKVLTAGIISTGDELVSINESPKEGQVRDINSYLLKALLEEWGCRAVSYGFIKDEEELLRSTIKKALEDCDLIVISGGSSVGQKDATARIIEEYSPLLFHGIAMKPGKPTILANYHGKALIGLPGHPGASFFVSNLFVKKIVDRLMGRSCREFALTAVLDEAISANQGRAVYIAVSLYESEGRLHAVPIQSKSGLVSSLGKADGYLCVPRDCEGFPKEYEVQVYLF